MKWILSGGQQSSTTKRKMRRRAKKYGIKLMEYLNQFPGQYYEKRYRYLIKCVLDEARNG